MCLASLRQHLVIHLTLLQLFTLEFSVYFSTSFDYSKQILTQNMYSPFPNHQCNFTFIIHRRRDSLQVFAHPKRLFWLISFGIQKSKTGIGLNRRKCIFLVSKRCYHSFKMNMQKKERNEKFLVSPFLWKRTGFWEYHFEF